MNNRSYFRGDRGHLGQVAYDNPSYTPSPSGATNPRKLRPVINVTTPATRISVSIRISDSSYVHLAYEIPCYAPGNSLSFARQFLVVRFKGQQMKEFAERRFDDKDILIIYIDGSKALRNAVDTVFGDNPVQRCRKHKLSNVMDHLPKELKDQVKNVMQDAWRLDPEEGKKRIRQQAHQLEVKYPSTTVGT